MPQFDVTTHDDMAPRSIPLYASLSSGVNETPAERHERLKAEWNKIIDCHLGRQTVDAWIADKTGELYMEYLERVSRGAMEDIGDRAKYMWDGAEWIAYAKERLGI